MEEESELRLEEVVVKLRVASTSSWVYKCKRVEGKRSKNEEYLTSSEGVDYKFEMILNPRYIK